MRVTHRLPIVVALLACTVLWAENIFEPWLTDECPTIVETLSTEQRDGIEVTKLKFLSREDPATGEPTTIYGVLARPLTEGKHPALLVCHGGGSYADGVASQAEAWAQRGYVSFCQDQPGICNSSKALSTGPWLTEKRGTFGIKNGDPTTSALFDGVVAALNGLALLRSRDDVDTSRVGVWGGSWGGYMTTMVSGLAGDRVKAAFAVYGCGFYDRSSVWRATLMGMPEADRNAWLEHLDAGRRAANMRAEYFNCAAANDWFFWPGAVMSTLAEIPAPTNQVFSPNDSHVIRVPGGTSGPPKVDGRKNRTHMEVVWFRHHLDGDEPAFARLTAAPEARATDAGIEVRWSADAPVPLQRSWVCYSPADTPWRLRWWKSVEAEQVGGNAYRAVVPVEDPDVRLNWYALCTDERNVTVSTLIQEIDPGALGFEPANATPEVFAEDFEGPDIRTRWRRRYADRSKGSATLVNTERRSVTKSLHIVGPVRWGKWGVRGEALRRSGARGIAFFAKSGVEEPVQGLDLLLVGEDENGARVEFHCPALTKLEIGTEWQRIEVTWDQFAYAGKGEAPIEMLSGAVGQLRIDAPEEPVVDVYVDDFSLLE